MSAHSPPWPGDDQDSRPTKKLNPDRVARSQDDRSTARMEGGKLVAPEDSGDGAPPPIGLYSGAPGFDPLAPTADHPPPGQSQQATVVRDPSATDIRVPKDSAPPKALLEHLAESYVIDRELGRGGMGRAYIANRRSDGETVVIKALRKVHAGSAALRRFEREAQSLDFIEHPNVVEAYETGVIWESETLGQPYIVMAYVPGRTLHDHIHDALQPPTIAWITRVFARLASAVAACHTRGIIHRDIKPANVLIDERTDEPVLIDFGLARADRAVFDRSSTAFGDSITADGQAVGTPMFMAPEQLFGEKTIIGTSADVWGFGATLYYSVARAYPHDVMTPGELVEAIETSSPPPLREREPEAPAWLEELCASCLQRAPAERPTMAQVQASLDARVRKPFPALLAIIVGAIALVGLLAVVLPMLTGPRRDRPRLLLDTSVPRATSESVVTLRGEVRDAGAHTLIFQRKGRASKPTELVLDATRSFSFVQDLEPGTNAWEVTLRARDGRALHSETITIVRQ